MSHLQDRTWGKKHPSPINMSFSSFVNSISMLYVHMQISMCVFPVFTFRIREVSQSVHTCTYFTFTTLWVATDNTIKLTS